jgi:hypothetical protein
MNLPERNPMSKINISLFASESMESIRNGNMSYVLEQIDLLPRKQAMAAVGYVVNYLTGDDYNTGKFLRKLSDRL